MTTIEQTSAERVWASIQGELTVGARKLGERAMRLYRRDAYQEAVRVLGDYLQIPSCGALRPLLGAIQEADPVESTYREAKGQWTGLDWRRRLCDVGDEYGPCSSQQLLEWAEIVERGELPPEECPCGLPEVTPEKWAQALRREAEYVKGVEIDARTAARCGEDALVAYRDGRYSEALGCAEEAALYEGLYGDRPVWGPFLRAVKAAVRGGMLGWWAASDQVRVHYPEAETPQEAARAYVDDGDWGDEPATIQVAVWKQDENGMEVEGTWDVEFVRYEPDNDE